MSTGSHDITVSVSKLGPETIYSHCQAPQEYPGSSPGSPELVAVVDIKK